MAAINGVASLAALSGSSTSDTRSTVTSVTVIAAPTQPAPTSGAPAEMSPPAKKTGLTAQPDYPMWIGLPKPEDLKSCRPSFPLQLMY